MSLPPCCPYHPAGVSCRLGQPATCHAAFAPKQGAWPPDLYFVSRPLLGSLSLRPGALLTIPKMALSVGFIRFVFSTDTTQAKGLLTFAPVGLPPTEHVCLSWTHSLAKILRALKMAQFPAATADPSRLSLHPRAPRISPVGAPAACTCIYKG